EIGPLLLEMKINDFKAVKKVDGIKFSIFARPTNIIVSATEMSEPLIGKSFPLRIEVKNESKGNASDLNIVLEIPEEQPIYLVRGTLEKRFYNLASGESTFWEINLKPEEEGNFLIKADVSFKDGDGNPISITYNLPLEIRM
ncbi:MAG: hypothetical protein ACTSXP_18820, partial [Promethearchaeota archaeon]